MYYITSIELNFNFLTQAYVLDYNCVEFTILANYCLKKIEQLAQPIHIIIRYVFVNFHLIDQLIII